MGCNESQAERNHREKYLSDKAANPVQEDLVNDWRALNRRVSQASLPRSSTELQPPKSASGKRGSVDQSAGNTADTGAAIVPVREEILGVSITFLQRYLRENKALNDLTTSNVCVKKIIPATKERNCAYVDLFVDSQDEFFRPYSGKATVVVCHAWGTKLSETLSALERYSKTHPDAYYWIDIFMSNHNIAVDYSQGLSDKFFEASASVGNVVVVLNPWTHPMVLTRSWCLLEIMSALSQPQVGLQFEFPQAQFDDMQQRMHTEPHTVLGAVGVVDASKAKSANKLVREVLNKALQERFGFDNVNTQVKETLVNIYIQQLITVSKMLRSSGKTLQDAKYLLQMSAVQDALELHDDAIECLQEARAIRVSKLTENHIDVASCDMSIASSLFNKGDYDRAIQQYEAACKIFLKIRGPAPSVEVIECLSGIGLANTKLGNHDDAIEKLTAALDMSQKLHGPGSIQLAKHFNNLAVAADNKKDYVTALECYREAMVLNLASFGLNHKDVASSYLALAGIYDKMQKFDDALAYYEKGLGVTEVISPGGAECAIFLSHMGEIYFHGKKDMKKTIEFHSKALNIRLKTLGEQHVDTAASYNLLGVAYYQLTDYPHADEYFNKALTILRATVGDDDAATKLVLNSVALLPKGKKYRWSSTK